MKPDPAAQFCITVLSETCPLLVMSSGRQTCDQCSYCPHLVNHTIKLGEQAELSRVYIKHTAISSRFTLVLNESQEVFVVAAFCSVFLWLDFYSTGFVRLLLPERLRPQAGEWSLLLCFWGWQHMLAYLQQLRCVGASTTTHFTSWLIVNQYLLNVNDSRHPDLIWWTAWDWGDCPHDWDVVKEWISPLHDFISEFRPSQMFKAPVHSLMTCCLNAALSKLMLLLLHE